MKYIKIKSKILPFYYLSKIYFYFNIKINLMASYKFSNNDLSLLSPGKTQTELHMLYSVIPKEYSMYEKTEFKKNRDFYKP
jgi:hypothetical protein